MPADATWFGPAARPLAGWLHVPTDGRARGGVVLCPPLGMEYIASHRALRLAAELLAGRGLVALRMDYDGTGESAGGPDDPDRVAAMVAGVGHAVQEVRAVVGRAPVALVGLRMGATLAAVWSAHAPSGGAHLDALVLWDACPSGRAFVRQQRSLGRLVGGRDLGDGSIDAPGFRYSAQTAEDLSRIDLASLPTVRVPRVLVLTRPEHDARAVVPAMAEASRDTVPGMPEMLDVAPPSAVAATDAVERLVQWLDGALPRTLLAAEPQWRAEADVGGRVTERHLRVGPLGLAAAETLPPSGLGSRRSVLFLTTAAESHMGPVRLWTELARAWALQGVHSVRMDLSGLGDSPTRPGRVDDLMYADHDEQDVLDVLRSGVVGEAPVVVGLCSGAHLALRVGALAPAASVVAVNIPTTLHISPHRVGHLEELEVPRGWPRRVLRRVGLHSVGRTAMRRLEEGTTTSSGLGWRVLVRAGVVVSPGRGLSRLHGHDATLICGPADSVGFLTRGRRDLERARARGLDFVTVDELDHVPMSAHQRQTIKDLLTGQVLRRVRPDDRAVPAERT